MANIRSGGYTFLIETLIATLFFSLSAAVLLQVFVASRLQAEKNTAQNNALLAAQTALETSISQNGTLTDSVFWYDENWHLLDSGDGARFSVAVTVSKTDASAAGTLYSLTAEALSLPSGEAVIPPLSTLHIEEAAP